LSVNPYDASTQVADYGFSLSEIGIKDEEPTDENGESESLASLPDDKKDG
jgi:hypothetical protein